MAPINIIEELFADSDSDGEDMKKFFALVIAIGLLTQMDVSEY